MSLPKIFRSEYSIEKLNNFKLNQRWNLKNLSRDLNLPKPGLN